MANRAIEMAPTKFIFSVVLLLSLLAATSTADHHRRIIPQPRPRAEDPVCLPGQAFPAHALPRCRAYLKRQCVAVSADDDRVAEPVRPEQEECCRQLAAVQDARCKCSAIAHMLESLYGELGVAEGGKEEAFPRCRTSVMSQVAARLPAVCGQEVPLSGSVCAWAI